MSSFCDIEHKGLLETIKALPTLGWYYGNITVDEAETILKNEPNKAFLVRDSSDSDVITRERPQGGLYRDGDQVLQYAHYSNKSGKHP